MSVATASPTLSPALSSVDYSLVRTILTVSEFIEEMQNPQKRMGISHVKIQGSDPLATIVLVNRNPEDFSFEATGNDVFICIDGQQHQLLSASIIAGSTLVFHDRGIQALVPNAPKEYNLLDCFQQHNTLTRSTPTFTVDDLVDAYQREDFKQSLRSVTVKHPTHRFISLEGVPHQNFSFRRDEELEKLILNIWEQDFDVEAISHQNGIHIVVVPATKNIQTEFIKAVRLPMHKWGDEDLLQAMVDGNCEAFGYLH